MTQVFSFSSFPPSFVPRNLLIFLSVAVVMEGSCFQSLVTGCFVPLTWIPLGVYESTLWFSLGPWENLIELTQVFFLLIKKDQNLFLLWVWNWTTSLGPELEVDLVKEVCPVCPVAWGHASLCGNGKWVVVPHSVGWARPPQAPV